MKSIEEQLSNYKSVHLNPYNVITHFVGVPMILWSIALLFSSVTFDISRETGSNTFSLLPLVVGLIFTYYLILHRQLAFVAIVILSPLFYSASLYSHSMHFYALVFVVFIIGWLFQFLGHMFEKAKPAFVDDINQLFIGPLFLIAEIYFSLGFDENLAKKVSIGAEKKRKMMSRTFKTN